MTKHLVLFRALNIGGRNKVSMTALRDILRKNGYDDVKTYLQSGNATVSSDKNPEDISVHIGELLKKHFLFEVPVLVRSAQQLSTACDAYPYADKNPKQAGIVFLSSAFDNKIDASACAPDECVTHGSEVFVHCPTGFGQTKLTNNWVEKQTERDGTRRNWNTVQKLVNMMQEEHPGINPLCP